MATCLNSVRPAGVGAASGRRYGLTAAVAAPSDGVSTNRTALHWPAGTVTTSRSLVLPPTDSTFRSATSQLRGFFNAATPASVRYSSSWASSSRSPGAVRVECLDWLLILGRRHLERVLHTYTAHYNAERPHRSLALLPPDGSAECKPAVVDMIERRDLLGGLIHEYRAAA